MKDARGLLGLLMIGLAFGVTSLILALRDWPVERLWLYLLAGTMLVLVGIQLEIFWVIVRVLDELSQREMLVKADMECV